MRISPRLIVVAVCALLPGTNFADPLDERVAKIREQLAGEVTKLEKNTPPDPNLISQLRRMMSTLSSARITDAQTIISSISLLPNVSEETRNAAAELTKDLPELLRDRTEEQIKRMNEMIERVAPACLSAKTEEDLNPLLKELGEARLIELRSTDPRLERAGQKIQTAIQIVTRWQDYLAQQVVGNPEGAASALNSLLQDGERMIIPRDEITKRLPRPTAERRNEEGLKLLASVQSLDQLVPVIRKLQAWKITTQAQNTFPALRDVERIASAYAALQSGLLSEAFLVATSYNNIAATSARDDEPSWYPEILRLRGLLLRALVPRILELEQTPEMRPEEDASAYLIRVTEQCVQEKRYAEASRVLSTYRSVAFSQTGPTPAWLLPDMEGLRMLAVGEQQLAAGSVFDAIKTLRKAVTTVGRFTPVAAIQARLKELEAQHPQLAEAATKSAETEQQVDQLRTQLLSEMQRSLESRMPPDIRARMRPQP